MRSRILILIFATFMILPVLVLGFGFNKNLGNKKIADTDEAISKVLSGDVAGFSALADTILERSKLTRASISFKNRIMFSGFKVVDTDDIVSGENGWLFYKPQFYGSECDVVFDQFYVEAANSAAVFRQMAKTVGINVHYSISPNKATVHPEHLGKRGAHYAGCNLKNAKRMREIFSQYYPALIDHAEVMKPNAKVGNQFFFKTDTHWNYLGFSLAMNQLRQKFTGRVVSIEKANKSMRRKTDSMSNLLLLRHFEEAPTSLPKVSAELFAKPISNLGKTIVLHDSFYNFFRETKSIFPNDTKLININRSNAIQQVQEGILQKPKTLFFNSVERASLNRFHSTWGTGGPFFETIMAMNKKRANQVCNFDHVLKNKEIGLADIELIDGGLRMIKRSGHFFVPSATTKKASCVRFSLNSTNDTKIKIYFPPFDGQTAQEKWSVNRYIEKALKAGANTFELVLPPGRKNKLLRINPQLPKGSEFKIESIELGTIRGR